MKEANTTKTSKTKKTEKTAFDLLNEAFLSDVNDKELQQRYDRFVKEKESGTEKYNELVPMINDLINLRNTYSDLIFKSAVEGIIVEEINAKYKDVCGKIESIQGEMLNIEEGINENARLIKKYEERTRDKLFFWWKSFKAIDPDGTAPWMTWEIPYKNIII